jgi:hypothetical protein
MYMYTTTFGLVIDRPTDLRQPLEGQEPEPRRRRSPGGFP